MDITHTFVSAKEDGTDTTLVKPSNWNAVHTLGYPIVRSVSRVVAGSLAPAIIKAEADYVCDGTNDDVEILAAYNALPTDGGVIALIGSFNIRAGQLVFTKPTILKGEGAGRKDTDAGSQPTILSFTGTGIGIDFQYNGSGIEGAQITALDANITRVFKFITANNSGLKDVSIIGGDLATGGVLLDGSMYFTFDDVEINGCGVGLALANITNGLTARLLNIVSCNTAGFNFGTSGGTCANAVFTGLYIQNNATGLVVGTGGYQAVFYSPYFEGNTTDIEFQASTKQGHIFINPYGLNWAEITGWDATTSIIPSGSIDLLTILGSVGQQQEQPSPGIVLNKISGSRDIIYIPAHLLTGGGSTAGTLVADTTAIQGKSYKLDAQNEWGKYYFKMAAPGKYVVYGRIRDTNQIANDVTWAIRNVTDTTALAGTTLHTATSAWGKPFSSVFSVAETDVNDVLDFEIYKYTATANEIYIDYLVMEPAYTQQGLAHIADPSGGATVDAEARTAINSILARLENLSFSAIS